MLFFLWETLLNRKNEILHRSVGSCGGKRCFFGRGGLALKKQAFSTAASDPAVENAVFFGRGGLALKKQAF